MSNNFKLSKVTIEAAYPRLSIESTINTSDRFQLVYNKFKINTDLYEKKNVKRFNLFFLHGTGMNKAIWTYFAEKLIALSFDNDCTFQFNSIITIDGALHGDSAVLNKGKIGTDFMWEDGSRDLLRVIEHETATDATFQHAVNVAIGHSLGGFQSLMAGFLNPLVFDSLIVIEPVIMKSEKFAGGSSGSNLMKLLVSAIQTEFNTESDFVKYMKTRSFYRKFHPQIMKDFLADEKYIENGSTKAKCSKPYQMIVYGSGSYSVPIGWSLLKYLSVPTLHIVGADANWNPPGAAQNITKEIPNCQLVAIPKGTHMVMAEQPDDTIKVIVQFLTKRSQVKLKTRSIDSFDKSYNAKLSEGWFKNYPKL